MQEIILIPIYYTISNHHLAYKIVFGVVDQARLRLLLRFLNSLYLSISLNVNVTSKILCCLSNQNLEISQRFLCYVYRMTVIVIFLVFRKWRILDATTANNNQVSVFTKKVCKIYRNNALVLFFAFGFLFFLAHLSR